MKKIPSLFIVDDHELFRITTKRLIEGTSMVENVMTFPDGEKAIERIKSSSKDELPDVIFLDISMPVMDGWEFLVEFDQLKSKLEKEIIIFIVSSSINPKDIEKANSICEVKDYLIKPVSKQKIVEVISALNGK